MWNAPRHPMVLPCTLWKSWCGYISVSQWHRSVVCLYQELLIRSFLLAPLQAHLSCMACYCLTLLHTQVNRRQYQFYGVIRRVGHQLWFLASSCPQFLVCACYSCPLSYSTLVYETDSGGFTLSLASRCSHAAHTLGAVLATVAP